MVVTFSFLLQICIAGKMICWVLIVIVIVLGIHPAHPVAYKCDIYVTNAFSFRLNTKAVVTYNPMMLMEATLALEGLGITGMDYEYVARFHLARMTEEELNSRRWTAEELEAEFQQRLATAMWASNGRYSVVCLAFLTGGLVLSIFLRMSLWLSFQMLPKGTLM